MEPFLDIFPTNDHLYTTAKTLTVSLNTTYRVNEIVIHLQHYHPIEYAIDLLLSAIMALLHPKKSTHFDTLNNPWNIRQ